MAAHGLTIVRQILKLIRSGAHASVVSTNVTWMLSAPGTCFTAGFAMESWEEIDAANERLLKGEGTPEDLLVPVLDAVAAKHAWMDAYPSMDAIKAAQAAYVRFRTPYWKTRSRRFDAGDASVHASARALIAARFPLERRAPVIL